jgi:ribose-phosphate pyrophosphokinase
LGGVGRKTRILPQFPQQCLGFAECHGMHRVLPQVVGQLHSNGICAESLVLKMPYSCVVLFACEAFRGVAAALRAHLPELRGGTFTVDRYENGEMHLHIPTRVNTEHCLILGSVSPPDAQLLSTLLLAHTLKKEGAGKVTLVLPYLAYARHDKGKPGQSMATAWIGSIFEASGCDAVISVDLHSPTAKQLFPIPLISISSASVFADAIKQHGLCGATIVAPDEGAIARCEAVRTAVGLPPAEIPYFEKHRTETGIVHAGPLGQVGSRAAIIDDILDTGITLISACEKLAGAGVKEISIMVTHGLFTGERWKQLWQLGVARIFCTDSVPRPANAEMGGVVTLSTVPLLASALASFGDI